VLLLLCMVLFTVSAQGNQEYEHESEEAGGFVYQRYPQIRAGYCTQLGYSEGIDLWVSYQALVSDDVRYAAPECQGQVSCNVYYLSNAMTLQDSIEMYRRTSELHLSARRLEQLIRDTYSRLKAALQYSLNTGNIHAVMPISKEPPFHHSQSEAGCWSEGWNPSLVRQWIDGSVPDDHWYHYIATQVTKLFHEEDNVIVAVNKHIYSNLKPTTLYYQVTLLKYNDTSFSDIPSTGLKQEQEQAVLDIN
jgi:hypothetical protein